MGIGRQTFFGTLGVGMMAAGAAILGLRSAHPPTVILVPALALLIVGAYLTIAAGIGAPPARPEIDPRHADAVRDIALQTAGAADPCSGPVEHQMLGAHFSDLACLRAAADRARAKESHTWDEVVRTVGQSLAERFPSADFWEPTVMLPVALQTLKVRPRDDALPAGVVVFGHASMGLEPALPQGVWGNDVIWCPPRETEAAEASDDDLADLALAVRAWFTEMATSPANAARREAIDELVARVAAINSRLAPIRQHERIDWSGKCFICRPKKRWQIWR